jgi:predicted dehydrogenase
MFIRARYGHGGRVGYENEWRAQPAISGGGELIDQGSHLIDLSRWFLGDLTVDYAAVPTLFWRMQADDNCFLALRSGSGQIAWLHASWTEWKNTFSFEIFGRDGKLVVDGLGGSYGQERLTYYRMLPQMGPPETTTFDFPEQDQSGMRSLPISLPRSATAGVRVATFAMRSQTSQSSKTSIEGFAMIIVRSPLRITLGGGGTDLPPTTASKVVF